MEQISNPLVYLDLNYGGAKAGRVLIELFRDKVPKAAENFRALCTGEKGLGKRGKPLHYKGTKFNKVISMCMVQGGDVVNNDGSGGESIYGDIFEDEDFSIKHEEPGMVGMMNSGPNSNQSQFYITTQPCYHLDDTNIVVGRVVKGLRLITEMSEYPRVNDRPLELLMIENCGECKPGESWNIGENDETEDIYTPWPDDCEEEFLKNPIVAELTINNIKNSGKHFYNKNEFINAERKYTKCLRYIDWTLTHKIEIDKIEDIQSVLLLNLAAVKLRRRKYKEAILLCNEHMRSLNGDSRLLLNLKCCIFEFARCSKQTNVT
ncbi:cyclophilin 40 isoform X2 [Leptinotarsa decemlineata]|uniref:cyclophilin 40 isoform X2 n=1 Tax=Leptinotarsa decemlineata TaxID=7539 RepID=UPI003D30D100